MASLGYNELTMMTRMDGHVVMRTMKVKIKKHYDSVIQNTDVKKSEERMYRSRVVILFSKRYTT